MPNPYAQFLGDQDPIEVLTATPAGLRSQAAEPDPDGLSTTLRPGGWAALEILRHLADNERVFAFRLRQCLAGPGHVIQPYDRDGWHALPALQGPTRPLLCSKHFVAEIWRCGRETSVDARRRRVLHRSVEK